MNLFLSNFNLRAWRWVKSYKLETAPNVSLIYGPRGTGKSTILHHLYKNLSFREDGIMTNALAFSRHYAYAAQEGSLHQFRQKYRAIRILILDDIQNLKGKVQTIEELLSTYEYILAKEGKVILALEAELPNLDFLGQRLASRFMSGLIISIDLPQENEILAFVENYIHYKHLFMDRMVPIQIAKLTRNLAEAIKIISEFTQYAELHQDALSLDCFLAYWEEKNRKKRIIASPNNIIRITGQIMNIPVEDIIGPTRKPDVNKARQLSIYLIKTLCQISFPQIASYFNRKHPTMITAYQKAQEMLKANQDFKNSYVRISNYFTEE